MNLMDGEVYLFRMNSGEIIVGTMDGDEIRNPAIVYLQQIPGKIDPSRIEVGIAFRQVEELFMGINFGKVTPILANATFITKPILDLENNYRKANKMVLIANNSDTEGSSLIKEV
jgi:hypothetical protein